MTKPVVDKVSSKHVKLNEQRKETAGHCGVTRSLGGWFGCNRWACGQVICCVQLMNCPSIVTTSFTLNRDSLTFSSTFVLHALCCIFASFAISCHIALHVFHYYLSHSVTCISLLPVTKRYMYFIITCHITLHVFHYYLSHSVTCISLLPGT